MSTVYLASYRGQEKGVNGLLSRLIKFFTKGDYSHTEICVGQPFDGAVLCVSSVKAEGGVRGKVMQLTRDEWDVIPLATVYPQQVVNFLNEHKGEPYDTIGAVRSVLPFVGRQHPTDWFCSEIAATIIGIKDPWRWHPSALEALMTERK